MIHSSFNPDVENYVVVDKTPVYDHNGVVSEDTLEPELSAWKERLSNYHHKSLEGVCRHVRLGSIHLNSIVLCHKEGP